MSEWLRWLGVSGFGLNSSSDDLRKANAKYINQTSEINWYNLRNKETNMQELLLYLTHLYVLTSLLIMMRLGRKCINGLTWAILQHWGAIVFVNFLQFFDSTISIVLDTILEYSVTNLTES